MPIINKPSTIQKATPATITLNKSQLALVSSVASNSYFSNQTNWKEVVIYYKSTQGNQTEILRFDATLSIPEAIFLVSSKSRNSFNVQKIDILDFDEGSIVVLRSELPTSEFDITLTSPSSTTEITEEIYFDESLRPLFRFPPPDQNKFKMDSFLSNYARSNQSVQQNQYLDLNFYITQMPNCGQFIVGIDNGMFKEDGIPLQKFSWKVTITSGEYTIGCTPFIQISDSSNTIVFSWNATQSSLFTPLLQPNNSTPLKIRITKYQTTRFRFFINDIVLYTSPVLNSLFASNLYPFCYVTGSNNPATFLATKTTLQQS